MKKFSFSFFSNKNGLKHKMDSNYEKLQKTLLKIQQSDTLEFEFLLSKIREIGIYFDERMIYGPENCLMVKGNGLWQESKQFGMLLSFLNNQVCRSYCEIGTFDGWSMIFIATVLSRNNDIHVTAVDSGHKLPQEIFNISRELGITIKFVSGTSDDIKGQQFDCTLIDGDHSYQWVRKDWYNVGINSNICIFHDINDLNVGASGNGPRIFFDELQCAKLYVTSQHPVMGYGIAFPKINF